MAATADPISVSTSLGARETIDLASKTLNLQRLETPQVSIHQCATKFGPQLLRNLFEKLSLRHSESSFEEINLSDNAIGDEGAVYLQMGLEGNTSLKTLLLPRTGLGPQGFSAVGRLLADLPNLEMTVLSGNSCPVGSDTNAEVAMMRLSTGLGKNKSLKSLCLANIRLGDRGVEILCEGPLRTHPTLEHLSLQYNRLEAASGAHISEMLSTNTTLNFLDLSGNTLGIAGAEALVHGLKKNKGHLRRLGLQMNEMKLQGVQALSEYFVSIDGQSLEYLDLRHNQVRYHGLVELREKLGKPMDGPEGWMLLFDGNSRQLLINAH
eukprot:CAMPEP_0178436090 /NCGR_PEP_ID=MMETSP0689_2-20121128/34262_1 /TAXON_ID=160604 /ORGANISM="Amphidinium massartii, Strain CS-259" /LENGTH=322 /DNA_ID=CAMNT_0020058179 /DNA_START=37 /DNA_END=1005 /DNA_ORIENTATION=+